MHHIVAITHHLYSPDPVQARVGDTISWRNDDGMVHTATSTATDLFDTGDIEPGEESEAKALIRASDHSGFTYYCQYHGSMSGTVFVEAATEADEGEYPKEIWIQMAQITAASWVFDMANDFAAAQSTATGSDLQKIQDTWGEIVSWWTGQFGSAPDFSNKAFLLGQSRDALEAAGRKIRNSYLRLRPLVTRSPDPNHPGNGQSQDPLGKAITIFSGTPAAQAAFGREIAYASAAFRIEIMQDNGQPVPAQLITQYQQRKAMVTADDYRLLAQHQTAGLQALFGGPAFNVAAFVEGMDRLTDDGEWDDPPFSIWHWLRWINGYLGVIETGVVPDLVTLR